MSVKRVLIVDDEPNFGQLISEYLQSMEYEVHIACNLEDALILFRKQKPKVVLLDFNMPMVTGEKFLPILQSLDPTVRVIVVTGCLQEEVEDKFKGLGYFGFFEKGNLSLEKVRQKVEEAFNF